MMSCLVCPRRCGSLRTKEEPGHCGVRTGPGSLRVAKIMAHYWEEPYISGTQGSGTVFFAGCPLGCLFCQNHTISQPGIDQELPGMDVTPLELAERLMPVIESGVHNINLVTASPYAPDIPNLVQALRERDATLPIVWNTSSYETALTLKSLEGSVDVYLPDFKFWDQSLSAQMTAAPDYANTAAKAILEMHRQQPVAVFSSDGLLQKGVALRLLVLPGQHRDAWKILDWIAANLPLDSPLAIMNQYTPFPDLAVKLKTQPNLLRRVTTYEYQKVIEHAHELGLSRLLGQSRTSASSSYTPDFSKPV